VSEDRARIEDVHELALAMPHVTVAHGTAENPVYQVGGKSFIFFRNPRPDAVDPHTGQRYHDVIVFWVASDADKQALIQDETSPFFTTTHFTGHPSVLLRASHIAQLTRQELAELIQDAWLARASTRRGAAWLATHPRPDRPPPGDRPAVRCRGRDHDRAASHALARAYARFSGGRPSALEVRGGRPG
jgi:hypothetical protein